MLVAKAFDDRFPAGALNRAIRHDLRVEEVKTDGQENKDPHMLLHARAATPQVRDLFRQQLQHDKESDVRKMNNKSEPPLEGKAAAELPAQEEAPPLTDADSWAKVVEWWKKGKRE